jgi:DNA-binding CsgD family transcriptional regulator
MCATDAVQRGRESYAVHAWRDAFEALAAAEEHTRLEAQDLDRLATAAYLIGKDEAAVAGLERAHLAFLGQDEVGRAVRCAFWAGIFLFLRGRHAEGGAWLGRAGRLLEQAQDTVEHGYLLIPTALQALQSGDPATAHEVFREAAGVADRFGDPDLVALSRLGCGQALVAMGNATDGVAMLDEAMLAVTTGEVSAVTAGIVYCALIIACRDVFDWRRAQEWTVALSRWCAGQQGLKPYRGQCLVHRSELMQLRGDWPDAMAEVQQACLHLAEPPGDPVLGMAHYQRGELLRLRGEFSRAEQAYRRAGEAGHPVQPGLALLRLAQGRIGDAAAAIHRVVADAEGDRVRRARVLVAFVEIVLAAGDVDAARRAVADLDELSSVLGAPYLRAVAESARGAVMLADGDVPGACRELRRAWTTWQDVGAPYEAARVRLLMAQACGELGDHDSAAMELDAARRVFEQLGAVPALARAAELSGARRPPAPGGLTVREVDVLRLVATGATNREVADRLVISEKTVARHVSNIFSKLGVASRAGATAYAFRHELV